MSNTEKKMTEAQIADRDYAAAKMADLKSKSATIRYLAVEWKNDRGRIAKALDIRYQHVRNVLTQPLKKVVIREATAADLGIEE